MKYGEYNSETKEFKFKLGKSLDDEGIIFHAKLMDDGLNYDITWLDMSSNERKYTKYTRNEAYIALDEGFWIKIGD